MGIVVRHNIDKILDKNKIDGVKELLAERILFDSNNYAPFDTGALRYSGRVSDGKIIWDVSYAKKLYNGKTMKFKKAQGGNQVGARWFDVAKANHGKDWVKRAKFLIGQYLGV